MACSIFEKKGKMGRRCCISRQNSIGMRNNRHEKHLLQMQLSFFHDHLFKNEHLASTFMLCSMEHTLQNSNTLQFKQHGASDTTILIFLSFACVCFIHNNKKRCFSDDD